MFNTNILIDQFKFTVQIYKGRLCHQGIGYCIKVEKCNIEAANVMKVKNALLR